MSPTKCPRKMSPSARSWAFVLFRRLVCEAMPVSTQSSWQSDSEIVFVVRSTLRKCWLSNGLNFIQGLFWMWFFSASPTCPRASSGKMQASGKSLIFSFVPGGWTYPFASAVTFCCSAGARRPRAIWQTMRCPSWPHAKAFDAQRTSSARTAQIFRMPSTLLHLARLPDLHVRKLLLQPRHVDLLHVADDDDRRGAAEVLLGELLDLRGRHRLHRGDVALDLVELDVVQRQLADPAGQTRIRLQRARELADQRGLARRQLVGRHRLGSHLRHLADDQVRHLRGRPALCLHHRRERTLLGAEVEASAGAVGQAALDADLQVQARRVPAAEDRVRHLREHVLRIGTRQAYARHGHHRLPRVR